MSDRWRGQARVRGERSAIFDEDSREEIDVQSLAGMASGGGATAFLTSSTSCALATCFCSCFSLAALDAAILLSLPTDFAAITG